MLEIHGYNRRLCCSDSVYNLIMEDAVREHLKHNPDKAGRRIGQNEMLYIIVKFYLGTKVW